MKSESGKYTATERFLRSCRGEAVDRPPVWLMRQAGRYLPEYRRVREGVSFLEMCRSVDRAVEVSLQPIDLVGSEAVILFQDIFTPIPGMGVELDFAPGRIYETRATEGEGEFILEYIDVTDDNEPILVTTIKAPALPPEEAQKYLEDNAHLSDAIFGAALGAGAVVGTSVLAEILFDSWWIFF